MPALGFTLEEIIREHTDGLNIPILTGALFGHGETSCPCPSACAPF
ncbi:MAG: hypothetical protein R3D66_04275 [Alphaproteobacteria bacterium]